MSIYATRWILKGSYRGRGSRKYWQAYLDGKISREEAIRRLVIETAPPKK